MSKDVIRQQFGAEAAAYASSKVHAKGASLARMVELVEPEAYWQALDIAAGAGHTAIAFAPYVAQVTATDITEQMLEQTQRLAKERGVENIVTEIADAEALPYADESFDLVTCRIAPHHFGDVPTFISESVRVLRPEGILAIVDNVVPVGSTGDYINALEKLRDPSHGRCLSIAEWTTALQDADITLIKQETLVKTLDFGFWAKRHDAVMQAYLLALLSEAAGEAAEFLQPQFSDKGITFNLKEGLFTGKKRT